MVVLKSHNLKVVGSNPAPATTITLLYMIFFASLLPVGLSLFVAGSIQGAQTTVGFPDVCIAIQLRAVDAPAANA